MKFVDFLNENKAPYRVGDYAYVYHLDSNGKKGKFYKKFRVDRVNVGSFNIENDDETMEINSSNLKSIDKGKYTGFIVDEAE
jgi:hypothetical protein